MSKTRKNETSLLFVKKKLISQNTFFLALKHLNCRIFDKLRVFAINYVLWSNLRGKVIAFLFNFFLLAGSYYRIPKNYFVFRKFFLYVHFKERN